MTSKEGEINVKRKAALYATTLLEVEPHITRINPRIPLEKEISQNYQMKHSLSEQEKVFLSENLTPNKLFLLPKEEVQFRKIEGQMRFCCKKRKLVQNYVLYQEYEALETECDRKAAEYFALRDTVAEIWDQRVLDFGRDLAQYLRACGFSDADVGRLHKILMATLPSKAEWYDSFGFKLDVREYPAQAGSLPGMDRKWAERTEDLARSLRAEQVTRLFNKAVSVLSNLQEGKSVTRKLSTLTGEAGRCLNHNIVDDKDLTKIAKSIVSLSGALDDSDLAEGIELRVADILQFADKYNIFIDMSECPVDRDYLETLKEISETKKVQDQDDESESETEEPEDKVDVKPEEAIEAEPEAEADAEPETEPDQEPEKEVVAEPEAEVESEQPEEAEVNFAEVAQFTLGMEQQNSAAAEEEVPFEEPSFEDLVAELMAQ